MVWYGIDCEEIGFVTKINAWRCRSCRHVLSIMGISVDVPMRRRQSMPKLPAQSCRINPTPLPETEILSRSQFDPATRCPMGGLTLTEERPG